MFASIPVPKNVSKACFCKLNAVKQRISSKGLFSIHFVDRHCSEKGEGGINNLFVPEKKKYSN